MAEEIVSRLRYPLVPLIPFSIANHKRAPSLSPGFRGEPLLETPPKPQALGNRMSRGRAVLNAWGLERSVRLGSWLVASAWGFGVLGLRVRGPTAHKAPGGRSPKIRLQQTVSRNLHSPKPQTLNPKP